MTIDQRPRGILSDADRQYLRNPEEYSKQAGYERRQAIIQRVHEALHDFPLLVSELDEDSRRKAFEDHDSENEDTTTIALSSAIAFLYLGLTDTVEAVDLAKDTFEDRVGSGVRKAYNQRGIALEKVNVDIEVSEKGSMEELKDHGELGWGELLQLVRSDVVSDEEVIKCFMKTLRSSDFEAGVDAWPEISGVERSGDLSDVPDDIDEDEHEFLIEIDGEVYDPTDVFE